MSPILPVSLELFVGLRVAHNVIRVTLVNGGYAAELLMVPVVLWAVIGHNIFCGAMHL